MVILDLFNTSDRLSFSEIQFIVRMDEPTLERTLSLLTEETPLLKKEGIYEVPISNQNSKTKFLPTDEFTVNSSFSSKSIKIKIPK